MNGLSKSNVFGWLHSLVRVGMPCSVTVMFAALRRSKLDCAGFLSMYSYACSYGMENILERCSAIAG